MLPVELEIHYTRHGIAISSGEIGKGTEDTNKLKEVAAAVLVRRLLSSTRSIDAVRSCYSIHT